ncbi:MAG: carbon-nitrogen family hydrolase [Verrucomicrobiota bacterium]|nr:carbon-nitrogen family hydrolase [Verrucomicrobiota bacterium]
MKVVCCQINIDWEDRQSNFARVRALIDKLRPSRNSLLILPEMFSSGFSMNVEAIHEQSPSKTEAFLGAAARLHEINIIAGLVTRGEDGKGRNEAVIFNTEGKAIRRYAKIHPFTISGEAEHYTGGDTIVTYQWQGFTVAPFICYDLRFPEVFRAAVRRGAQLFVVIANWPSKREQHWVTLLQARAIENQAYVIGVNRVGTDPRHNYSGRSLIIDPHGNIIVDGGREETVLVADLDLEKVVQWRREFPALQDMRSVVG